MGAEGGASLSQSRTFGTIRLPGKRGVRGAINPGEGTDWFKIDVIGRNLKFGSFGYSAAGVFDNLVQPQVNLFFRARGGGLQRIEAFPAVSDDGSVRFAIKRPGTFFIQLSAQPVGGDLIYTLNFSAAENANDADLFFN